LNRIDVTLEFNNANSLPVPGGYLVPALTVGLLSRIFRLHSRVSDWLGIRECFDVDVIILEMADQVGIDVKQVAHTDLVKGRRSIMRDAFYRFVGGSKPQIDSQLIEQALDAWSWLWIGIEATLLFALTGFALVAGGARLAGFETLGGTLLAAGIGLPILKSQCRRYAVAQVKAICNDARRADLVRAALSGLPGIQTRGRRTA
jgi:hypothetical protein